VGTGLVFIRLKVDLEVALARNLTRSTDVSNENIVKMHRNFEPLQDEEERYLLTEVSWPAILHQLCQSSIIHQMKINSESKNPEQYSSSIHMMNLELNRIVNEMISTQADSKCKVRLSSILIPLKKRILSSLQDGSLSFDGIKIILKSYEFMCEIV